MAGLMQPGPTLYEAEQQRKKKGSRGLLGEVGEPLSYAPGPVGLLGNALLAAQYATGEKPMDEGLSALAMLTGMMQGTKVAPIVRATQKLAPSLSAREDAEHAAVTRARNKAIRDGLSWEDASLLGQRAREIWRAKERDTEPDRSLSVALGRLKLPVASDAGPDFRLANHRSWVSVPLMPNASDSEFIAEANKLLGTYKNTHSRF